MSFYEITEKTEDHRTQDNLWNFLFFTGYLKAISQKFEVDTIYVNLAVPNEEVRYKMCKEVYPDGGTL